MAYDEALKRSARATLARRKGVTEKKMFGGVCFLVNGHMCCGVNEADLVLRLGEEGTEAALEEPYTRPFDITGKTNKTMLFVAPRAHRSDDAMKSWVERALGFARSLPPKQQKPQGGRR